MKHGENKELIKVLDECAAECTQCASSCESSSEKEFLAKCIRLNKNCADFCRLTSTFLSRDSEKMASILEGCERICLACADECDKHHHLDYCKHCAMVCRKCAQACR